VFFVDKYYLPGSFAYKNFHFIHQLFIYGYNDQKEELNTISFQSDGSFDIHCDKYPDFIKSFEEGKEYYNDPNKP
jgi:hypothetical protein